MLHFQVESEAGLGGEASLAQSAGKLPFLLVHTAVILQLGRDAESLATFRAAMPTDLRMNTTVVFESEQVGVGLEAHGAVVDADSVGVFVVKE